MAQVCETQPEQLMNVAPPSKPFPEKSLSISGLLVTSHAFRGTTKQRTVGRVEAKPYHGIWTDNRSTKETGFLQRMLLGAQEMILPPTEMEKGYVVPPPSDIECPVGLIEKRASLSSHLFVYSNKMKVFLFSEGRGRSNSLEL